MGDQVEYRCQKCGEPVKVNAGDKWVGVVEKPCGHTDSPVYAYIKATVSGKSKVE
jgi:hypothetical protein